MKPNRAFIKKYIHHRNLLIRGQLELSIVIGLINTGMLLGLFLRGLLGVPLNYVLVIVITSIFFVGLGQYFLGLLYDRKGLIHEENDWTTSRTPILGRIEEAVKQMETGDGK